jgi:rod shape-determining protein MreD
VRAAGLLLALAGALALQTTLSGLSIGGGVIVDLVLVLVVYAALAYGAVTGLLIGTAAGLTQDALAGGVLGIGGFSKTLVGFLVGVLGAQFIVSQPLPRFVMFVVATVVHELCFQALSSLADLRAFRFEYAGVLTQAAVNGLLGIVAFQVVEAGPGLLQRRRARGATLSGRRF